MDTNLNLIKQRLIKFNEKGEDSNNKADNEENNSTQTDQKAPESKPVTASIQDVMATYAQGALKYISMTGNRPLPMIEEGVTEFEYEGSEVTTYRKGDLLNIQIKGKIDAANFRKRIEKLKPIAPVITQEVTYTGGVNGEIDESVRQGGTGDCWILTGVFALNSTEVGKQIIKNSIQANSDGSVTITFKGLGVSYTISADEIKRHDTDNIKGDAYSNGDNDMLALELATKKLMEDIASGKVKLNAPADSFESIYNEDGSIEGGFPQNMIYYLTGQSADFICAYNDVVKGLPQDEVIAFLAEAYKNGNTAMTFGIYGAPHNATLVDGTPYKLDIQGGHALAITNITATTITFVNPWNSTIEYTMTWEEFAKLGIGMFTSTDLSGVENVSPVEPDVPVAPAPEGKIYTKSDLWGVPQSIIDKFFEPVANNTDGTSEEWVLKPEYSDVEIEGLYALCLTNGSVIRDLSITTTSIDENGNEVKKDFEYFSKRHLDSFLGGDWWRTGDSSSVANKYFELDDQSGLYMLKDGMSLEELKNESPATVTPTPEGKIYTKSDLSSVPQSIIDKFFVPVGFEADGAPEEWVIKSEYSDIEIKENCCDEKFPFNLNDGSAIIRDLVIITTSINENGNEVKKTFEYFSDKNLRSYYGPAPDTVQWKRRSWEEAFEAAKDKFFEYDKESGLYMLKEGKDLSDMKDFIGIMYEQMKMINDPANPVHWNVHVEDNGMMISHYDARCVKEELSVGIIDTFFESTGVNKNGEVWGYSLKAPYKHFMLVSNGETERVYRFSYEKDGVEYISTVTIDETDGSYRIKNTTKQVITLDYHRREEIIESILDKMN